MARISSLKGALSVPEQRNLKRLIVPMSTHTRNWDHNYTGDRILGVNVSMQRLKYEAFCLSMFPNGASKINCSEFSGTCNWILT